ncbi:PTS glucose transporter subunit IIA [Clostridium sp. chh4-2]|uniref:PTS sugar transporter subunit IIA n=1 Tax=Clostridium sp. chh4-2 TaxID=2067550 RepID=UPI00241FFB5E|nr:PTS glucose transporter subunit IIA [Clostridium sp. chh4-2]
MPQEDIDDKEEKAEKNDTEENNGSAKGCLYAAQTGEVIALEKVPDEVFSQKIIGEGIAIIPSDTMVVAPAAGEIVVVAETKHAYAIAAEDGAEVLIHIGLETVNLQGKGFEALVKLGDKVQVGTPLCRVDESLVNGKTPLYTPMIITNSNEMKDMKFQSGNVTAGKDCVVEYIR